MKKFLFILFLACAWALQAQEVVISGSGGGGPDTYELRDTVTQTAHGFVLPSYGFIPVRHNGAIWVAANTTTLANAKQSYVVQVLNANTIVLQQCGALQKTGHGLTVGREYFLQDNGTIGLVPDSDNDAADIQDIVCQVISTDRLFLKDRWPVSNVLVQIDDGVNPLMPLKSNLNFLLTSGPGMKVRTAGNNEVRFNWDITGLPAATTIAAGDSIPFWDSALNREERISRTDFANSLGFTSQNFANTDLTATGNRSHAFAGNTLNISGTGAANLFYLDGLNGRGAIGRNSTTATQSTRFSVNGNMAVGSFTAAPVDGLAVSGDGKFGSTGGSGRLFALYTTSLAAGMVSYVNGGLSDYTKPQFLAQNTEVANGGQIGGIGFESIDTSGAVLRYFAGYRKYTRNLAYFIIRNNGTERLTIGEANRGFGINQTAPNPNGDLHVGGTFGIILPQGTKIQVAPTPAAGTIRYNTTDNVLERYNGSRWISNDRKSISVSANGTESPTTANYTVVVNTSAGAVTRTLPNPSATWLDYVVSYKNIESAVNNLVITTTGGAATIYDLNALVTTVNIAGGDSKSYQCVDVGGNFRWVSIK